MAITRLQVEDFLTRSEGQLVLDVRSPAEYEQAHVPGAVSFPLFSNEERKVVGTIYKQQSREQAIKTGLDIFGPKMRPMVEKAEQLVKEKTGQTPGKPMVFVYCWRGGMRSAGIAWLLDLYGFSVYSLAGGYKAFRNYALSSFEYPYKLHILGGFTGSGKTELLQELDRQGIAMLDLETLAAHKGSAFGKLNMPPQPRQEHFENLMAMQLRKIREQTIWVEDESQRIGQLNIPGAFWNTMRSSPVFFLDIPFEARLDHITQEYSQSSKELLMECTGRITKRLGGLETKNALSAFESDNYREAFRILLQYYDKLYLKSLHNREALHALLTRLPCEQTGIANVSLLPLYQTT